MDFKNLFAVAAVGEVDSHATIKAAGTQERRVEHVGSVRRRHHHHLFSWFKAVHLDEDLIERLLTFVVAAAHARTAHAPDRVDLVDEDDRGRGLLCELEEVTHTRGADADKHFDEFRTAN